MDCSICVVFYFFSTLPQIRYTIAKNALFSVFHLTIKMALMTTLCQYPLNSDNPQPKTKKYMFCDKLQDFCYFQLFLKINTNAVIYCKIVFGSILQIRIMLMTTFSQYQHKYGIVMHCKNVRHTYFLFDKIFLCGWTDGRAAIKNGL